jgi:Skp family chaperone for outer membrane proteins
MQQNKFEEDSKKEDELIIKEREKLIEQQSVMAPEAFEVKVADFEKKVQTYQIERQDKLRKLDQMVQTARATILDEVKPIINDYANELGITVILEKNAVVMSADDMDMTDQVIEILNKSLPKIKVELKD